MTDVAINFAAPPTVADFMASNAFVRLIVGPVGSGKSSGCITEILRRAAEQAPGPDGIRRSRWLVVRNTYGQLRDTTRKTFEQWVPRELGEWNEQKFSFTMRFNDIEAEVLFRALDRPEDKKKLLSLEVTGAYINEARELPQDVFDVLQSRVGRYPSKLQGGASWWGIWMDTNPMHTGHWLYSLMKTDKRPRRFELFEQPDGLSPDAENVENLPLDYYVNLCDGKDAEWVDEYVRSLYPKRDKGSIYGDLLADLERLGFMREFEHPSDGVFISYDLGISDATAQWYWRVNGVGGVDVVDHYEASGKPISHFFDEAEKRSAQHGYEYRLHWLPHDARARTLTTGASVVDSFIAKYGSDKLGMTPELSLEDGLQAARWLLEKPCRFHPRAKDGLRALRSYRYAWDDDRLIFSRKPVHDWASHSADAFRYVACAVKTSGFLVKPEEVPAPPKIRNIHEFTLDDAYALSKGGTRRERI